VTKHWPVQDAKAKFSELLRAAEKEPQIVTFRGKPKVEIRSLASKPAAPGRKAMSLAETILSAPKVPEFGLPPRRREKPRKLGL
jgi:prevent-host-death family protein